MGLEGNLFINNFNNFMKHIVKKHYFGTDGVRGLANRHPMTPEFALKMGKAAGKHFSKLKKRSRIVIGKDTRLSGYILETALTSGICSMGCDVLLVGPMPTPAISFLTRSLEADAGIVISASHNPFLDNGIKFFGPSGEKLPDRDELGIEEIIHGPDQAGPTGAGIGKAFRIGDAAQRYSRFVVDSAGPGFDLEGVRLVLDCANGASYEVAPSILRELGAKVSLIGCSPDGLNINAGCGSTHPEGMAQETLRFSAQAGIALDGDGDRVIMADEKGNLLDGDDILFLCATELKERGQLDGNNVVGTIMTNVGLEAGLEEKGIGLLRAPVGDRFVVAKMLENNSVLGGEPSGHIIFRDHSLTGDGLVTALRVLKIMGGSGSPLSSLVKGWSRFPQVMRNLSVSEKIPLEGEWLEALTREARSELGESHLLSLRYSGTESFLRVTVSAASEMAMVRVCDRICAVLFEKFGWKVRENG